MLNRFFSAVLLAGLAACQSASPPTATPTAAVPSAISMPPVTSAPTPEAARTAVARYLRGQPNAALYVLDSASVLNADAHWQVLVPRTDWARRMPNKAAFEVDKATGKVTTRLVK